MSVAKVLRLDEYRDRRTHRLRLAEVLHRVEPQRHAVFSHLAQIASLSGADRVATVWVDEYGTGLIHPHVVLDQLSDRPRRRFAVEPLREAWELGVPSAHDRPSASGSPGPATFAVSLGSDGTRAWFIVAESMLPRPALAPAVRDRIMFLAGECASVVLHRDLGVHLRQRREHGAATGFAGWPILEDMEGREDDEVVSARIARRFVVGRLARMLLDDELVADPERLAEQVRRARTELVARELTSEEETVTCHRVLDALADGRFEELAGELVQLGDKVEGQGHLQGALELYRCAYGIALALGAVGPAVDAARLTGRLLRRQAAWDEARFWFEVTREIADVVGLPDVAARALVGLGGIRKETGNLPGARDAFNVALGAAEQSGDHDTIALVHHGLLGIEQAFGNVAKGLEHGWLAVATYRDEEARTRCMASIAAALTELGDREAAEDAWSLVAHSSREVYYLVYAHDALGHLHALKGDGEGFRRHSSRADALGWEAELPAAKAEILFHRGLSHQALGNDEAARHYLSRALEFAESHGYSQVLFKAERALESLARAAAEPKTTTTTPAAPPEVREGLRAMRRELVGAGV